MRTLWVVALGLALVASLPPAVAAQTGDLQAEMIGQFDDAANKILQLAEAIPQEKYGWRPAEGVRSVSEVLMHVVGGNFYIPSFAGAKMPEGVVEEFPVTEKAQVIHHLKRSFEHVRTSLRATADADLSKPAKMFGRETTCRNVYLTTVMHAHEHLGQLIAYARSNGVVPPWSMASGE